MNSSSARAACIRFKRWGASATAWVLLLLLIGAEFRPVTAQPKPAERTEFELKAAYLYHFAQFIEWPAEAFTNSQAPIVIGVVGKDPFGKVLDDTVRDKTVKDRPFVVRRLSGTEGIKDCHIVYVSSSEKPRLPEIIRLLNDESILSVNEDVQFTRLGGVVNFMMENKKVRFEINMAAAEKARLKLDAQLLRLAKISRHSAE
ncbi:MAG: YfiR family protein [Verrucomicrobiota bacterium]